MHILDYWKVAFISVSLLFVKLYMFTGNRMSLLQPTRPQLLHDFISLISFLIIYTPVTPQIQRSDFQGPMLKKLFMQFKITTCILNSKLITMENENRIKQIKNDFEKNGKAFLRSILNFSEESRILFDEAYLYINALISIILPEIIWINGAYFSLLQCQHRLKGFFRIKLAISNCHV